MTMKHFFVSILLLAFSSQSLRAQDFAALKAKRDKSEEEIQRINMISSSYDISDKLYIQPILECLKM